MDAVDLAVVTLATYYASSAIVLHDGPLSLFVALRRLGRPFTCIVCLSVWVAAAMIAVHALLTPWVARVLATAGAALLLRSYTGAVHDVG